MGDLVDGTAHSPAHSQARGCYATKLSLGVVRSARVSTCICGVTLEIRADRSVTTFFGHCNRRCNGEGPCQRAGEQKEDQRPHEVHPESKPMIAAEISEKLWSLLPEKL